MKDQKSPKNIVYFIIIIITLILYYGIRKNEENYEKIMENQTEQNLAIDKLLKGQIEDDIHLNNSELLNIKINSEEIKKLIIKEQKEKESNTKNINETSRIELWMIETFFLTVFCIIIGGFYFYSKEKEKKDEIKSNKKKYMDNNKNHYLSESEMEYLLNKDEMGNNYNQWED